MRKRSGRCPTHGPCLERTRGLLRAARSHAYTQEADHLASSVVFVFSVTSTVLYRRRYRIVIAYPTLGRPVVPSATGASAITGGGRHTCPVKTTTYRTGKSGLYIPHRISWKGSPDLWKVDGFQVPGRGILQPPPNPVKPPCR